MGTGKPTEYAVAVSGMSDLRTMIGRLGITLLSLAAIACAGSSTAWATTLNPTPVTTPGVTGRPHLVTLGDSITLGGSASDPSNGYAALLASSLGATWTNLGVSGETSYAHSEFRSSGLLIVGQGGVLADQVSKIPPDCAADCIVTLYIGVNDQWESELPGNPVPDTRAAYSESIADIVKAIRSKSPLARIVAAAPPNLTVVRVPSQQLATANIAVPAQDYRIRMFALARSMKAALIASRVTVVDLLCEPEMYDLANYADLYDVHPNDGGHRVIAAAFLRQIKSPSPTRTCAYETAL